MDYNEFSFIQVKINILKKQLEAIQFFNKIVYENRNKLILD